MIHPTAIVDPAARIDDTATIGPWCQIGPDVQIGPGARLMSHVVVDGHTVIGADAVLYPFCTVGLAPQDLKYRNEPTRCEIGPRTQLREHCSVHRGTEGGGGLTRVGADCLLMAVVHVAHDCLLGDGIVVANNVVMGGHVTIGDGAIIGGAAALHQFVRIGRGAIVGGVSGVEADVIPFGSVVGNRARLAGLNLVGLKRRGIERAELNALRAAFRLLFRAEGVFSARLATVRAEFAEHALVREMLAFIDQPSRRGLIRSATNAAADSDAES